MSRAHCPSHGATYTRGCFDCAEAANINYHARTREKIKHGPTSIESSHVLAHVTTLLDGGCRQGAIAKAAGVSPSVISNLVTGKITRIMREIAERILAVTWSQAIGEGDYVDATLARRRMQHLAFMGWSQTEIGRHIDMVQGSLTRISNGVNATVTRDVDDKIAGFFREYWTVDGGSIRAKNMARRRGWVSILEYANPADPECHPGKGARRMDRYCRSCGELMTRRHDEREDQFRHRSTCDDECSKRYRRQPRSTATTAEAVDFAASAEGRALIEQMRGAA